MTLPLAGLKVALRVDGDHHANRADSCRLALFYTDYLSQNPDAFHQVRTQPMLTSFRDLDDDAKALVLSSPLTSSLLLVFLTIMFRSR